MTQLTCHKNKLRIQTHEIKSRMNPGKQGRYKLGTFRLTWIRLLLAKRFSAMFKIKRNVRSPNGKSQSSCNTARNRSSRILRRNLNNSKLNWAAWAWKSSQMPENQAIRESGKNEQLYTRRWIRLNRPISHLKHRKLKETYLLIIVEKATKNWFHRHLKHKQIIPRKR